MPTSTPTRPGRRWIDVESAADTQVRAMPNLDRLNGGGAPRELAPILVVARRATEPDTSVVPTRYSLPWRDLVARRLRGEDVAPRVRVYLRDVARGRASSPGQVLALREWLRTEIPAVLAQVDLDALALGRPQAVAAA